MFGFYWRVALHCLLLPVKILVSLALRWLWWPGFGIHWHDGMVNYAVQTFAAVNEALEDLDLEAYAMCGDGAKFVGMAYVATRREDHWQQVRRFIDITRRTFTRYPKDCAGNILAEPNFSGDMLAGILLAVLVRMREGKLTETERHGLRLIWERVCFEGTPLLIKHPNHGESVDRGFLWRWFTLGPEALTALAFLAVGIHLSPDDARYKTMYRVLRFTHAPLLFLCDYGVFVGKAYAIGWYNPHSKMLIYCAGAQATNDLAFGYAAANLLGRYGLINPDIAAAFCAFLVPLEVMEERMDGLPPWFRAWWTHLRVYACHGKGGVAYDLGKLTGYFSIRSRCKKAFAPQNLMSPYRAGKYIWEESPIMPRTGESTGMGLDLIFPALVCRDMWDEAMLSTPCVRRFKLPVKEAPFLPPACLKV